MCMRPGWVARGPSTAWKSESSRPEEPLRCIATGDPNIERRNRISGRRSLQNRQSFRFRAGQDLAASGGRATIGTPKCDGGVVSGVDHSEGFQPLASTHRRPAGFSPAVNPRSKRLDGIGNIAGSPRVQGEVQDDRLISSTFARRRLDRPCHAPPQSARAGRGQAGGTLIRCYSFFSSSSLATRRKPSR
ncbi:hypothetical protein ACVIIW_007104 [Bradyrhizobium sp. USDA 4449]